MKKIGEIAVALLLFFGFGASFSVASTNIDTVDHYAKVLIDGSYLDFGCPIIFPTIVSGFDSPMNAASTFFSRSSTAATQLDPTVEVAAPATTEPVQATSASAVHTTNCDVFVSNYTVTGTAHGTSAGDVSLNPFGGGVFNDAFGNLSGYAWGDVTGWVNFAPVGGGVTIDASGYFHGLAWSQNLGWIAFDCASQGACASDPYRVRTSWRPGATAPLVVVPTAPETTSPAGVPPTSTPVNTTPVNPVSPSSSSTTPTPASPSSPTTPTPNPTTAPVTPLPTQTTTPVSPTTPTSTTPTVAPVPPTPVAPATPGIAPSPTGSAPTPQPTAERSEVTARVKNTLAHGFQNLAAFLATAIGSITFKSLALLGAAGMLISTSSESWRSLLSLSAIRKRKPWGTVYDSVTKQPLDPAYVVLMDMQGNEINTSITDLDGRYGFLAEPGTYKIVANKTNYVFPSARLAGRGADELYGDLYFGEDISILMAGEVITKNIPLDPMNSDWNEQAKRQQNLMKFYSRRDLWIAKITSVLFWFGFALSIFAWVVIPQPLNLAIVGLYILIFLAKETILKPKKQGMVVDKNTGEPMPFAIMRIFSSSLNTEIAHKPINAVGKYFALVPNGNYYVKIEKKNPDGSYTSTYTSEPFEVTKGVINKNFMV